MKHINQNLKRLTLACLFALALDSSLQASTNPLTDKSKHIYHPKNRDELVQLLKDDSIKLDTIDTSKITDMSHLFRNIKREDFSGIESWDVSKVTDMGYMFYEAHSFNQPIDSWDVRNVANMAFMFNEAKSFNQPLGKWNVSNVTNMESMFSGAQSFNQNLNSWNVSNVKNMDYMFENAASFRQNLDSWKINKDARTKDIFSGSPLESKPPKWYK